MNCNNIDDLSALLLDSKVYFIVDGSFYSCKPHLITAAWKLKNYSIISSGDFISLAVNDYQHLYEAELYDTLKILEAVDYILTIYSLKIKPFNLGVGTDFQSVIDAIINLYLYASSNRHIH